MSLLSLSVKTVSKPLALCIVLDRIPGVHERR